MDVSPKLLVLRGNSGSGKSSVARALRERYGYGLAWVEQDYLRRVLLREKDVAGGTNIALIDLNVRYALAAGYHVILEGILASSRYGEMLRGLHTDHGGFWYYFDLTFNETVQRHSSRPQAKDFSAGDMRGWYQERDLLPGIPEQSITAESPLNATVERLLSDTGLNGVN